jgi:hypothetical protein
VHSISRLVLTLPPDAAWTTRTQTMAVLASTDGAAYTSVLPSAGYTFDPTTKNIVTVPLRSPVRARYLRLTVSDNTGWPAAQFSEIEVFP